MFTCWKVGRAHVAALVLGVVCAVSAQAQASKNLAPGFTSLPKDAKVLVAPIDVELFSMSAGGVMEPKADWTEFAQKHMKLALDARAKALGLSTVELTSAQADDLAEALNLQGAVSRALGLHHTGYFPLPTKEGRLDWTAEDALRPLQQGSGARYGLFTWVRDSYASAERKAMMVGMALLGIGISGGVQVGYASLVDLDTGRVLWFNQLARASGDLREGKAAEESVGALLQGFPPVR